MIIFFIVIKLYWELKIDPEMGPSTYSNCHLKSATLNLNTGMCMFRTQDRAVSSLKWLFYFHSISHYKNTPL